jgi:hypothetical protein
MGIMAPMCCQGIMQSFPHGFAKACYGRLSPVAHVDYNSDVEMKELQIKDLEELLEKHKKQLTAYKQQGANKQQRQMQARPLLWIQ